MRVSPEFVEDLDARAAAHVAAVAALEPAALVKSLNARLPVGSKVFYAVGLGGKIFKVTCP